MPVRSAPLGSSSFSPLALRVLRDGHIIDPHESPEDMIERVADVALIELGRPHAIADRVRAFRDEVALALHEKKLVPSTPILTNAGRRPDFPLSACAVPPLGLREDLGRIRQVVDAYHRHGMGTGFNLDDAEDPVGLLRHLNDIAVEGSRSGLEDRPVGNMGVLSVYHPRIRDFITAKTARDRPWKFNISVNVDDDFMEAERRGEPISLRDGTRVDAGVLFREIAAAARECGDPGIVFVSRMNGDNPTPHLGEYVATAPCGEVGLASGETCQFGSINLGRVVRQDFNGRPAVDYDEIRRLTGLILRYLDDALDYSLPRYARVESTTLMGAKRKIGIGVCGFADLLIRLGIPYASAEAKALAEDVMSFINFNSKVASIRLARDRGAFVDFCLSLHNASPSFTRRRYAPHPTGTVSSADWESLDEELKRGGMRNAVTTALPPTGRSSLVFDCSQQIEPLFRLTTFAGEVRDDFARTIRQRYPDRAEHFFALVRQKGHCNDLPIDPALREVYRTATDIAPPAHLDLAASFQKFTDEGVSKTINLPAETDVEMVTTIYRLAYQAQLKGITIYRDGSHQHQPVSLSH